MYDCRVGPWRSFTATEENYWSLTCLEESQNLGQSYYMLLILMIMRISTPLQHKDILSIRIMYYISFFTCMYCMLDNFAGKRTKEKGILY
jgi:hypothetical protein